MTADTFGRRFPFIIFVVPAHTDTHTRLGYGNYYENTIVKRAQSRVLPYPRVP